MSSALSLIYYILNKFLNFIFGSYLFSGVSIGMISIVIILFALLIKNMLNVPTSFGTFKKGGSHVSKKPNKTTNSNSKCVPNAKHKGG